MENNDGIKVLIFVSPLPIIYLIIISIRTLIYYCRLNIKQKIFMKKISNKIEEVSKIIIDNDNIYENLQEINKKINDIYNLYNDNKIKLALSYIYFDKNSIVDEIKKNISEKNIDNKENIIDKLNCLYENNIIIIS
jgi:hypothetical protein